MFELMDFHVDLQDGPPGGHRADVKISFKAPNETGAHVTIGVVVEAPLSTSLSVIHRKAVESALEVMAAASAELKARPAYEIIESLWAERGD